ncbi:MAG: hypothetical protein IJT32_05980 [Lachnospiraceae bacterium]|nr:hypothetical protein [Lachnospiraceae bacterium]
MEFASGIPGSIGGAVMMNAGAYGGEMKDIITAVNFIPAGNLPAASGNAGHRGENTEHHEGNTEHRAEDTEHRAKTAGRRAEDTTMPGTYDTEGLSLHTARADALSFSYRHSIFMEMDVVITSVVLQLERGDPEAISAKMKELNARRIEKQPLEYPSAGSTFKRPEGYFAGKLIEDAGLRGYRVGGAAVSQKHCGFVVNDRNATAQDVYDVIRHVQREVKKQFGVTLEPEVRLIGTFRE